MPRTRIKPTQIIRRRIRTSNRPHIIHRITKLIQRHQSIHNTTTNTINIHVNNFRTHTLRSSMNLTGSRNQISFRPRTTILRTIIIQTHTPTTIHIHAVLIRTKPCNINTNHRANRIILHNIRLIRTVNNLLRKKRVIRLIRELPQHLSLIPCRILTPRTLLMFNPLNRSQTIKKILLLNIIPIHPFTSERRQIKRRNRMQRPILRQLCISKNTVKLRTTTVRVTNRQNPRIRTSSHRLSSSKHVSRQTTSLIQKHHSTQLTSTLKRRNNIPIRRAFTKHQKLRTLLTIQLPRQRLRNTPRQLNPITESHTLIHFKVSKHNLLNLRQRRSRHNTQRISRVRHRNLPRNQIRNNSRLPTTIRTLHRNTRLNQKILNNLQLLRIPPFTQHIRQPRLRVRNIQPFTRTLPQIPNSTLNNTTQI